MGYVLIAHWLKSGAALIILWNGMGLSASRSERQLRLRPCVSQVCFYFLNYFPLIYISTTTGTNRRLQEPFPAVLGFNPQSLPLIIQF